MVPHARVLRGEPHTVMRRLLLISVVAALAAGLLPAGSASAGRSFTFFGSGFGHGIGMSQWGANGLARMGWNGERIVEHFYRGAEVRRTDRPRRDRGALT